MPFTREALNESAIKQITNFCPDKTVDTGRKHVFTDLGKAGGLQLGFGICRYEQRVKVVIGGLQVERQTGTFTEQPSVAILKKEGIVPLPYQADVVQNLTVDQVVEVANHLRDIELKRNFD